MEESNTLGFEIQRKEGEEEDDHGEWCSEIESPPSIGTHRRFLCFYGFFLAERRKKEENVGGAVEVVFQDKKTNQRLLLFFQLSVFSFLIIKPTTNFHCFQLN